MTDLTISPKRLKMFKIVTHALVVSLKAASIEDGFCVIVPANVSINLVNVSLFVRAPTNLWNR